MATQPASYTMPVAIQSTWQNVENAADAFAFVFDAVVSEDVSLSSVVTRHPVDVGVSIADHMYDEPDQLTIHAVVSDVLPWDQLQNKIEGKPVFDPFADDSLSRSAKALSLLDTLRRKHEPFNVQTGLRLFTNVVVEKIDYTTNKDTSAVLSFTAKLTQITIAETLAVLYPPRKDAKTKRQAAKPTDEGKKETAEPEKTPEEMKSMLFKLLGGLVQ